MSRSLHIVGLNSYSLEFISDWVAVFGHDHFTEYTTRVDGGTGQPVNFEVCRISLPRCKPCVYDVVDVWYGDGPELQRWVNPEDPANYVEECIQQICHSAGPVVFIALRWQNGDPISRSLWTDEEMQENS